MLSAASPLIDIHYKSIEVGIKNIYGIKGEQIVKFNLDALNAGREITEQTLKAKNKN